MTPYNKLKYLISLAPQELKNIIFDNKNVPQRKDKHPEGNVLKHTMVVTMRAIDKYPNDIDIILAALFHDLGKRDTLGTNPKTGEVNALGHENFSAEYVDKFSDWIFDLGGRPDIVFDIVQNHMLVKKLDDMKKTKQTEFYGKKNFDKIKKFSELDKGGFFEPPIKESIKEKIKLFMEQKEERYMFFSNLEQLKRQCELLLEFPREQLEMILDDGHDWAQDHIAVAKENMDQVFDFIMNETEENSNLNEGKKKNVPTNPALWQNALAWAKRRYKVCPSAYCNGAAAKRYKSMGGKWKTKS